MNKMIKIPAYLFGGFIAIVLILGIAIRFIVTKEFIVEQIENNINGRIEIADISVPLWAALSGITLEGFKLGPKDKEMEKPVADRAPMENYALGLGAFRFEVAIGKLITSGGTDFQLKALTLEKPEAKIVLYKEGGNNLTPLLLKPVDPNAKPEESGEAEETKEEPAVKEEKPAQQAAKPGKEEPFSIKSIPTRIELGEVGIKDGNFLVTVQSAGQTLKISNFDLLLKDLLINPQDLDKENQLKTEFGLVLELAETAKKGGVQSFRLDFSSYGLIRPFNPKTGFPSENLTLTLLLRKDTYVTGLSVLKELQKNAEQFKKAGVDIGFLGDEIRLNEDAQSTILYSAGKIIFKKPPIIKTKDFRLQLTEEDYLNVKSMDHLFRFEMLLSNEHSSKILSKVDGIVGSGVDSAVAAMPAALRSNAEKSLDKKDLRNKILGNSVDPETDRLIFAGKSSGNFSSPALTMTKPSISDPKEVIADALKDAGSNLKDALSDELNKQKDAALNKANEEAAKAKAAASAAANKAKAEAEAKAKAEAEAAKRAAEEEAKRKAAEEAKKALGGGKIGF